MSRFIEILNRFHGQIDLKQFRAILEEMKARLDAEAAHVEISFPFFLHENGGPDDFQMRKIQRDCRLLDPATNTVGNELLDIVSVKLLKGLVGNPFLQRFDTRSNHCIRRCVLLLREVLIERSMDCNSIRVPFQRTFESL